MWFLFSLFALVVGRNPARDDYITWNLIDLDLDDHYREVTAKLLTVRHPPWKLCVIDLGLEETEAQRFRDAMDDQQAAYPQVSFNWIYATHSGAHDRVLRRFGISRGATVAVVFIEVPETKVFAVRKPEEELVKWATEGTHGLKYYLEMVLSGKGYVAGDLVTREHMDAAGSSHRRDEL